jgi:hypothetical protein
MRTTQTQEINRPSTSFHEEDDDPTEEEISIMEYYSNHNTRPRLLVRKEIGVSNHSNHSRKGVGNKNAVAAKLNLPNFIGDDEDDAAAADVEAAKKKPDDDDDDEPTDPIPRLVYRDRAFYQSSNKLRIQHNKGVKILSLLKHNWFHACLRLPTYKSLPLLLSSWTIGIIVFALLYIWFDHANAVGYCRLGADETTPITFGAAFAFSLETCTTVGT